jgi:D-alanyl-D-alanine carboxypeptidase (penicillin-binding protein 5/6)
MKTGRRRHTRRLLIILLVIAVLGGYGFWSLTKPLPALQPQTATGALNIPTNKSNLAWPAGNQAAAGVLGTNILETHGPQVPAPTASTAKIITALMVLKQKPLPPGQPGPFITMNADDVNRYKTYVEQDGSVLPVQAGQQLTEYQLLQALMLPSANNIADTLAIWAYGSLKAYGQAANEYLASQKLTATHVGSDASGLAPDTVSTAADLVKIGKLAMRQPALAEIAGQSTATGFPHNMILKNVNGLLGSDGIIGIKTGNSTEAGGVFVGAANAVVNGKPEIIVTAVMKAQDRAAALRQSQVLIRSAQANFKPATITKKNTVVGSYKLPWGGSIPAVTTQDLTLSVWQGTNQTAAIKLNPTDNTPTAGETVGRLTAQTSALAKPRTVPIKLQTMPPKPSAWWRLTHSFF